MRYAVFSFSQPFHHLRDEKSVAACSFYVRLSFEAGVEWILGRGGEPQPYQNWIFIPHPACTRKLASITAIQTSGGAVHFIECLHNTQTLTFVQTGHQALIGKSACKRPLKDGDRLKIDGLPCQISYKIFEELSGRLEDDTVA